MVLLSIETRDSFGQYCTSVGVIRLSLIAFCSINFFKKCKNNFVQLPANFSRTNTDVKRNTSGVSRCPEENDEILTKQKEKKKNRSKEKYLKSKFEEYLTLKQGITKLN